MESITELRKICQTTAKKDISNVYMRYVSRFLSIYFTRMLLPTRVTANQVSLAMIIMGFVSSLFFLSSAKATFFIGALLLQAWYIIDCMDGEVARYRHYKETGSVVMDKKDASLTGMYYDMINHYIVNFLVPATIGFGLFQKTGSSFYILLGLAGSLAQVLMRAMYDAKCRALLTHLQKYQVIKPIAHSHHAGEAKKRSFAHTCFMILHYMMTYPTVMNLVGLAAILNLFSGGFDWRFLTLFFLSVGSVIVSLVLIVQMIQTKAIERELQANFETLDNQESVSSSN